MAAETAPAPAPPRAGGRHARPPPAPAAAGSRWSRADTLLLGTLLAVTAATRLRWASTSLYTVDSVLFALGTEDYDVLRLQPHPPGYPVYVALGWLARHVWTEANTAFVMVNLGFSLLAVAATYALARAWGPRSAATVAAGLFTVAPAFAFNGAVALSYTAEAAASAGIAWLAWRCWQAPTSARLAALGAAWGIAVGIRQSLFLFLAPLVAAALLDAGARWPGARQLGRRCLLAGAPAAAAAAAWFLPMVHLTGGYGAWRRATALQGSEVVFADAVWVRGLAALVEHAQRMRHFLQWEVAWLLPLLAVAAAVLLVRPLWTPRPRLLPPHASVLAAVWLLPCTLFYLLVFNGWDLGPLGYILTLLPGVYVLAAIVLVAAGRQAVRWLLPTLRPAAAVGLALLLAVPAAGLHAESRRLVASEAHAHDRWTEAWSALPQAFPPEETAILVWHSWAHVKWYFPEYLAWTYFPSYRVEGQTDWALFFAMHGRRDEQPFIEKYAAGPGQPEHPVPGHVRQVVVFDFQLAGEGAERRLRPEVDVREAWLPNGWRVLHFAPVEGFGTIEAHFTPDALGAAATPTAGPSPA
ncbi:MAG TPA: hypothetical protein VFH47_07105 [Candidatus Thermoplasmatota archaeon]|nr:hypothetical protein [Candidatus Thermoplasmatota archaeon]